MKVKISDYPGRLTARFHTLYMDGKYGYDWPDDQTKFESMLEWLENFVQTLYSPVNYFLDKRTQKVSVRIDRWDIYSIDYTLAPIILPMLVQLKERKHGCPDIDDEDVPEELRSSNVSKNDDWYTIMENRWDWILDEMIYAFDCKANKDDVYMRFGSSSTDVELMEKEQDRISNGFRLFGKYYESLWI